MVWVAHRFQVVEDVALFVVKLGEMFEDMIKDELDVSVAEVFGNAAFVFDLLQTRRKGLDFIVG